MNITMNRRTFIFKTSGLIISACVLPAVSFAASDNRMDRIGMGTVLFRNRVKQTRPKDLKITTSELTLLDVPITRMPLMVSVLPKVSRAWPDWTVTS